MLLFFSCSVFFFLFFSPTLQKRGKKTRKKTTMLHTSCNTYHVQFGFLKNTVKCRTVTELDSSLNPDNALALIFLKDATFTQGLNKISHIGSMAKLRVTTTAAAAATAFLNFFQKDKGVLRIQFVLSFGRRRRRRRRKSAFDIRPLAWAIILSWGGFGRWVGEGRH